MGMAAGAGGGIAIIIVVGSLVGFFCVSFGVSSHLWCRSKLIKLAESPPPEFKWRAGHPGEEKFAPWLPTK
jgi:hypothetical protein